ncbi:MAG TPA: polysaccharide deacetylase family protein, partial [Candidatus Aphodoplasma excrementigallinarum]|nr:polysaccharide deacetylase family protein [Candidatus Aphodoplasma excrementigallinarum]
RLVGDKTMVPLRFLSEEMGYTVEWDEETRMATITAPNL